MSYFGIPIRNGLPIGLGSVAPLASGGGSPFSPLSLFATGAPGAWYDPSDYTTLFQDSAGTTPVTAVEQPVGLMLDKSQGLVLGSELVTNGDFSNGATGWNKSAGTTISGGVATLPVGNYVASVAGGVVGKVYFYTFTIVSTTGSVTPYIVNQATPVRSSAGTYSGIAVGKAVDAFIYLDATSGTTVIDNISVKELLGNHAFQATSASRPVLSARYNLLTKTEQFDDAVWLKTGVVVAANSDTAPDGTFTADKIYPSVTSSSAGVGRNTVGFTAASSISASCYFKAAEKGFGYVQVNGQTGGTVTASFVTVDLTTGTAGSVTVLAGGGILSPTVSSVSVGDGWWRLTLSGNIGASNTAVELYIGASDAQNSRSVTASGTSGIYIWGASLVPANQSTLPYQRVNTATDYATTGFLPYLKFDGVDDSLSTNSISFTATDKMSVFAGVRKLSDAAVGVIAELSSSIDTNAGTFLSYTQTSSRLGFASRGSATAAYAEATQTAAPFSLVYTGLGDISGDLATLRVNGAQVVQSTANQGTGNFGNYPLYIGRRNNASLPFNGQMYSMIIVGKAVTAGELSSTETYTASKTGVVLA